MVEKQPHSVRERLTKCIGVITHVTLKTYSLGKVWGGTILFTGEFRDELMQAFANYQKIGQHDQNSAVLSYLAINKATEYASLMYLDVVERPAAFEPFYISGATVVADTTSIRDSFSSVFNEDFNQVVLRFVIREKCSEQLTSYSW
jgi:hypothetical protein